MISYELYCRIKQYGEREHLTPTQIAEHLGLDRRTVAYWLSQKHYRQRESPRKPSKLDPFKPTINRLLEKYPYTATQLLNRIREEGYQGGYSILVEYVARVRPVAHPAYLTLAFPPGETAQLDWGEYKTITVGNIKRKLNFFVMVLCHSRLLYLEFTLLKTMEHFLTCQRNAFTFFGGVPKKVMIDNLKSGVLRHWIGHAPVLNPHYAAFAQHYGFEIVACAPRRGNEKGRVESGVGYVKKNFLAGHQFPSFEAVVHAGKIWRDTIANVRLHGETKKIPLEVFRTEEHKLLQSLPANDYDTASTKAHRVSTRFRVTVDTNRYSVPPKFAGKMVTVAAHPDRICCYHDGNLIARHSRHFGRRQDIEDPDHVKELLETRKKAQAEKKYHRFITLCPEAPRFYQGLSERRLAVRHHIDKILSLCNIYSQDAVARAIKDANELHAFSSEYILNLLEQQAHHTPITPEPLQLARNQDLLNLELQHPDLSLYDNE